ARTVTAPQLSLDPGAYDSSTFAMHEQHVGLIVLEGLLLREVVVAGRVCGELLDGGSLLRPWDRSGEHAPLPYDICWRVLEPARLAVLNDRFIALSARWPGLSKALIERSIERAQRLALSVAIHSLEHVELRLLVLFWNLADRFGRVTRAGTVIPVRLTHSDLGKLVGAQRPTVSRAIAALSAREVLARGQDKTWVLLGEPPAEVRDLRRQQQRSN
ncbi:MAG: Crp/Fnr family transcriptional regulator, partial [Solirubrobacteraceae bacterium]